MSEGMGRIDRRQLLKGVAAAGVAAAARPLVRSAQAAMDKLVIGVIYVGPRDDYGYNQAQAQAAAAIKKIPGVTVVEQEKVPETTDVQKTMGSMIEQDGATLLFPTSFGYFDPHILRMAEKYPKVRFAHCGGLWTEGKHPKNVGSYFGYIDECQYLNGVVAGHASKSKKLGFSSPLDTRESYGGVRALKDVSFDLRHAMLDRRVNFIEAEVARIDPVEKRVTIAHGEVEGKLPYDFLVFALGRRLATERACSGLTADPEPTHRYRTTNESRLKPPNRHQEDQCPPSRAFAIAPSPSTTTTATR